MYQILVPLSLRNLQNKEKCAAVARYAYADNNLCLGLKASESSSVWRCERPQSTGHHQSHLFEQYDCGQDVRQRYVFNLRLQSKSPPSTHSYSGENYSKGQRSYAALLRAGARRSRGQVRADIKPRRFGFWLKLLTKLWRETTRERTSGILGVGALGRRIIIADFLQGQEKQSLANEVSSCCLLAPLRWNWQLEDPSQNPCKFFPF